MASPRASADVRAERQAMIERARALVPVLRTRADQAETARHMSPETHASFVEAGFYRIHQPRRYGGHEFDLTSLVDISAELGRGCGSSAWIFSNLAVHSWMVGMHHPQTQEEVWGSDGGSALIASSFPAKGGKTRKVDGGFILDGLWSFSSGVDFANWQHAQLFIPNVAGLPEHRFGLVPMAECEVVDDWFPSGLAATGSRSVRFRECFVPERRTLRTTHVIGAASPGSRLNEAPLYRIPPLSLGAKVFSGPILGMARGALEVMVDELRGRRNVSGTPMSELPTAQARIAEASAEIDAAWALLLKDCRDAQGFAEANVMPDLDRRARWHLNNAFAGQLCLRAVERLHPLIGARGLDQGSAFQRAFRDIHAAVLQITMSWDIQAVNAGRVRFGLPSLDPRL